MRTALFLFLFSLTSLARADMQSLQYMHETSTRTNLLVTSAMVYFNPEDRTPDPRSLIAYFDSLYAVNTKITQLGQPEALWGPYTQMEALFKVLDNTPRKESAVYPEKIRELLLLNQQLQTSVLESFKAELEATPSKVLPIYEQSQAMAKLLYDYQLRRYPLEDKTGLVMDAAQIEALDAEILKRFETLGKSYPSHAEYIEKVHKSYKFVRSQLLQAKGRPSGGAEFYLTRGVIDLNDFAFEIALSEGDCPADNPQCL
jgi:hypothetical protein